jgi:hypothetical protein
MEFTEKFIAFIDILGFKKLVETAETGAGMRGAEVQRKATFSQSIITWSYKT